MIDAWVYAERIDIVSSVFTITALCPPGSLTVERTDAVLDVLARLGFQPIAAGRSEIVGVDASGTRPRFFDDRDGASAWLAADEGKITLWARGADDIALSVHRADGVLPFEMVGLPDEAVFDVVAIEIKRDHFTLRPPWLGPLLASVEEVATAIDALYLLGHGDDELVAQADRWSLHSSIAGGTAPPVTGWIIGARADSGPGETLGRIGDGIEACTVHRGDHLITVRLADEPGSVDPLTTAAVIRGLVG